MTTTQELLTKALQKQNAAAWARELNVTRAAMSHAKKKGRVSPVVAGALAIGMGEDPMHWVAVAALEAETNTPELEELRHRVKQWRRR